MAVSSERGLFSQAGSARDRQARVWGASHHRGPRHRIVDFLCASIANGDPCFVFLYSVPFVRGRSQRQPFVISLLPRQRSGSTACEPGGRGGREESIACDFWCGFRRGLILVPLYRRWCKFSTIFVERTQKLGFVDKFCEIFVRYLLWLLVACTSHSALPRHLQPAGSFERPMILWGGRPEWVARSAFWGGLVSKGAA